MATYIELSDDDDSFEGPGCSKSKQNVPTANIILSSDEEIDFSASDFKDEVKSSIISDDEELPDVVIQKKTAIKSLFTTNKRNGRVTRNKSKNEPSVKTFFPPKEKPIVAKKPPIDTNKPTIEAPKQVFNRMIGGVNVMLPVNPYGSQVALMSKIINGIKKGENCILESPTGSGKTLALLCGALAWQQHEQNRISQLQAQQYFTQHPEVKKEIEQEGLDTTLIQKTDVSPEKLFSKNKFGEKSIYEKPEQNGDSTSNQRQEKTPYRENSEESPSKNLVAIHKRRRVGSIESEDVKAPTPIPGTPDKKIQSENPTTPENVSVPTIYYGARTHTQLKQVIKEFKRTWYCGVAKMTLLSSRDKSCIKEFNKNVWSSRNDMCRACVKPFSQKRKSDTSQCQYYDNRANLNHNTLPPAFDLEELVEIGKEKEACPYYGARQMAKTAHIVFCPYNYLIDPIVRNSLSIHLEDNILIIDEAHNIESICRDAASAEITRIQIRSSLMELEKVAEYQFQLPQDEQNYIPELIYTLKNWDYWFENQKPLVNNKPLNNNEAVHKWDAEEFVNTLNNHNIGYKQYNDFKRNSEKLCRRLMEDPRTLFGVTQATGSMLETLQTVLGYLFRCECKFVDDFKPVLIRQIAYKFNPINASVWRSSNSDEKSEDLLTLSLICLNPGIVMSDLHSARCIALASGTLTPLISLHSELATSFPHRVSPNHVIPEDRVWIGTLVGDSRHHQRYTASEVDQPHVQHVLAHNILRVCQLTPHGVLCFLPSYSLLTRLENTWKTTGVWDKLHELKHVFCERRSDRNHEETMEEFYQCVATEKGALLFAVYRGKISEGMDFKDHQARAVICVGIPYPSRFETSVGAKMEYNDKYCVERSLLDGSEWLRVQAFRALNQAVGRCVRHRGDWGAVLLVDARYLNQRDTEHLSNWVRKFLGHNHHTYESLLEHPNGLAAFMQRMKTMEDEENSKNT